MRAEQMSSYRPPFDMPPPDPCTAPGCQVSAGSCANKVSNGRPACCEKCSHSVGEPDKAKAVA